MRAFKSKSPPVADPLPDAAYQGDGLSVFTHRAAKSKQPLPSAPKPTSLRDLIKIQEHKLRKLYAEHRAGIADPVRLARVRRDIDICQAFTARLWVELGEAKKRGTA
jgi:hypothetical protein